MDRWQGLLQGDVPAEASHRLERYEAIARQPLGELGESEARLLTAALVKAPYLMQLLTTDSLRLRRVAADPYLLREKPLEQLGEELEQRWSEIRPDSAEGVAKLLRQFRADELVRLGFRELELETPVEVGRELANLADQCFEAALRFHHDELQREIGPVVTDDGRPIDFTVIAMGKLGGRELNFASDVDVIYVYDTDEGSAGELTVHQYFTKLCREVTAAIGRVTEDGVVFRVDLRLRPEGTQGAIVNSLPSLERYYETFGRPWERQAWIKARPCAGSQELGEECLSMLRPFVYPRAAGPEVIEGVRELNQRIKQELVPGGVEDGFDVKNGYGGIREVEFFVQALQLVHGGRMPAIRARSTIRALNQLLASGLISEGERRFLSEAYLFLRHVEHVLQLESGRQTQRLPSQPGELERFCKRLGFTSEESFLAELHHHTELVAEAFATLGGDESQASPLVRAVLTAEIDSPQFIRALEALGVSNIKAATRDITKARSLASSPLAPSAPAAMRSLAERLLDEIASCASPDRALSYLTDLIARRGTWALIWRLMTTNQELARLVISLFATSDYLARLFVANPELTDALLPANRASPRRSRDELRARFGDELPPTAEVEEHEDRWNVLAALKNSEVLRIGLGDIAGDLDSEAICEELSHLADVCLEEALATVSAGMRETHGIARTARGDEATLAVLAMGKLGGEELGYASDLDVVFVYSDDGMSDGRRPLDNVVYMTRLAQRLMGGLHVLHPNGRLYELDTRLRPSGRAGLLVSSWSQWQRYHRESARLWERQALTKLRFVAGNAELGKQVESEVQAFLYSGEDAAFEEGPTAQAIAEMRDQIERELGAGVHGYDLKTGPGGLIDIEFAAQFLQLCHGQRHAALRVRATTAVLEAAAEAELAEPVALATLIEGYRFLRGLEHRMRIVHDRPVHALPRDTEELRTLARRCGHESGAALTSAYERWTSEIRSAYRVVLRLT